MIPTYLSWAESIQHRIYKQLNQNTEKLMTGLPDNELHDTVAYVLKSGRAIRPQLVYAAHQAIGSSQEQIDHLAQAIELIHIYSLIYDDLPCMDNSPLRRGQATAHIAFKESSALLAGDALKSFAFEMLTKTASASLIKQIPIFLEILAQASGYRGLCLGQAIDLDTDHQYSKTAILKMYSLKTGALIKASVLLGGHAHPLIKSQHISSLVEYGESLGLAFQIINDLHDTHDQAETGKTPNQDTEQNKNTILTHHTKDECASMASLFLDQSLKAAHCLPGDCGRLQDIVEWTRNQLPTD